MKIILTSVVDDKQGQGKRLDGNVENVGFMFTVPSLMGMFQLYDRVIHDIVMDVFASV